MESHFTNESFQFRQDENIKIKCRRSNTTYTLTGTNSNNKVIDYFNKLELSKPVKKTANIRKLNKMGEAAIKREDNAGQSSFQKDDAKMLDTIESLNKIACSSEVEKIQDVLFHDESLLTSGKVANSNLSISSSKEQDFSDIDSPSSSINSGTKLHLLDTKNQSSPQSSENLEETKEEHKLNETRSINCSMEKLRRTISMSGIENVRCLYFFRSGYFLEMEITDQ